MNKKIIAILTIVTIMISAVVIVVVARAKIKVTECVVTFSYEDGTTNALVVKGGNLVSVPKEPLLDGYRFLGWYVNGKPYDFSEPIKESITLVARYEKLDEKTDKDKKEYEIKFDTDGGSDIAGQRVVEGEQIVRPNNPTKSGYTFNGWTLNGSTYNFDSAVNGNITLKAEWEKIEYVTVTFNTDGGSNIAKQTIEKGKKASKPSNPAKSGYVFNGWTLNGNTYSFDSAVDGNITLKAEWEKIEYVTVTFNTDGGSNIAKQIIEKGKKASKPSNPAKSGYVFNGWTLNGNTYSFDSAVGGNITLKAEWEKIEYVTVTFNTDGGSNIAKQIIEKGKKASKPSNPAKSGYVFNGWTLNGNTYSFDSAVDGNITLKAVWKKETTTSNLKVIGDVNGDNTVNAKDITILRRYISADIEFSAQEKLVADVNQDGEIDVVDVEIIRKYLVKDIKSLPYNSGNKYKITYNLDGGKLKNVNEDLFAVYAEVCLPYTLPELIKEGYVFVGWTGSNGSTPQKNVVIAKGTTRDLTYTANWRLLGDVNGDGKITARDARDVTRYIAWHTELKAQGMLVADVNQDGVIDGIDAMILSKYTAGDIESLPYNSGNKYRITYNLDGGKFKNGDEKLYAVYAELCLKCTLPDPVKEGYVFVGWTGSNGSTPQKNVVIAKGTTGDLAYTANWRLLGDVNGDGKITARDERDVARYIAWHTELTAQGILVADVNQDGVIDGIDAMILSKYTVGDIESLPYNSGNKYRITYNLDGGKFKNGDEKLYAVYAELCLTCTLPDPVKEGYVFVGWTGSNGSVPQKNMVIAKGTTGDLTYTANWRAE